MEQFPEIKTKRLILNGLKAADIPQIVTYAGDERIAATTLNIPHPYQEEDAIYWISKTQEGFKKQSQYTFAVRLQNTRALIGGIGLIMETRFNRAVLGYWLGVPFWNQGYTTEAASAIAHFGFETLGLNKIYATHLKSNPASGKIMQKIGMIQEGTFKQHIKKGDTYFDLLQYGLTQDAFKKA